VSKTSKPGRLPLHDRGCIKGVKQGLPCPSALPWESHQRPLEWTQLYRDADKDGGDGSPVNGPAINPCEHEEAAFHGDVEGYGKEKGHARGGRHAGNAPITIPIDVPAIMAITFERVNAWLNPTAMS